MKSAVMCVLRKLITCTIWITLRVSFRKGWDNSSLVCISQACTLMSLTVGQSSMAFVKLGSLVWLLLWDVSVCLQETTKSYFLEQGTGVFLHSLLQATFSPLPQKALSFSKLLSGHLGTKSRDTHLHSLYFFSWTCWRGDVGVLGNLQREVTGI